MSAGPDRAFGEPRRVRILACPGAGVRACRQSCLPHPPRTPGCATGNRYDRHSVGLRLRPGAGSAAVVAPAARCPGGVTEAGTEESFPRRRGSGRDLQELQPMRVNGSCTATGASLDAGAAAEPAEAEARFGVGARSSFRSGPGPVGGYSRSSPDRGGKRIAVYIYGGPSQRPERSRPDARAAALPEPGGRPGGCDGEPAGAISCSTVSAKTRVPSWRPTSAAPKVISAVVGRRLPRRTEQTPVRASSPPKPSVSGAATSSQVPFTTFASLSFAPPRHTDLPAGMRTSSKLVATRIRSQ